MLFFRVGIAFAWRSHPQNRASSFIWWPHQCCWRGVDALCWQDHFVGSPQYLPARVLVPTSKHLLTLPSAYFYKITYFFLHSGLITTITVSEIEYSVEDSIEMIRSREYSLEITLRKSLSREYYLDTTP